MPVLGGNPRLRLGLAVQGQAAGLVRPIILQASVAAYLAADRGHRNVQYFAISAWLCLALIGFHKGVYLISLFLVSCV